MSKKLFTSLSNFNLYKEELPESTEPRRFGQTVLRAIKKTLSASSISYLQTLQETEQATSTVEASALRGSFDDDRDGLQDDAADDDLQEALRRSLVDQKRRLCELELKRIYRDASTCEDEGSSSGRMTPTSEISSRLQPSSSSGVTYQDLYPVTSSELK